MSVQITDVDCVHVDDMDVLETSQGEIGEDLASEASRTDDENFALIAEELFDLERGASGGVSNIRIVRYSLGHQEQSSRPFEDLLFQGLGLCDRICLASRRNESLRLQS